MEFTVTLLIGQREQPLAMQYLSGLSRQLMFSSMVVCKVQTQIETYNVIHFVLQHNFGSWFIFTYRFLSPQDTALSSILLTCTFLAMSFVYIHRSPRMESILDRSACFNTAATCKSWNLPSLNWLNRTNALRLCSTGPKLNCPRLVSQPAAFGWINFYHSAGLGCLTTKRIQRSCELASERGREVRGASTAAYLPAERLGWKPTNLSRKSAHMLPAE